jgi:hypothetical protein
MHSATTGSFDLVPLTILVGLLLLFVYLIFRSIRQKRAIENLPLTDINVLRQSETRLPALAGFAAFGESARPIRLRLSAQASGAAIVVGMFALIGIGIAWGCFYQVRQDARYAREGRIAIATVRGADVSAGGRGANRVYQVRYEFEVNGQKYAGSGDLPSHKSLRDVERTQQVSVQYLGSDPQINRPSEAHAAPIVIAILAPLALFLPLAIFALALRRDRELLAHGLLSVGRVIGITSSGRRYSRRFYYDFADAAGQVRRGSSWLQSYSVEGTNVGAAVHVFYLPEDPGRNSLSLALLWRF